MPESTMLPPVGVLGLGSMGAAMASNLVASPAVPEVWLYSRRAASAEELVAAGGRWCATAMELGSKAEVVVVALPRLADLEGLLESASGLLASPERAVRSIVLTSTCPPQGVRELAQRLSTDYSIDLVDAPVSGGVEGARAATLSIMVGHEGPLAPRVSQVLGLLGVAEELGPVGAGQVAKACNQLVVAGTALALAEACVLASRSGIRLEVLLPMLARGYAGGALLAAKAPKLIAEDYSPDGRAGYMLKDLNFACEAAVASGTRTPLLDLALGEFRALVAEGLGDQDLAVVRRHVEAATR